MLLLITSITAQVTAIDSNYAKISRDELKYITNVFVDYSFLKNQKIPALEEQRKIYERMLTDQDSVAKIKDNNIGLLMKENKILQPTFWDGIKLWIGIIGGLCAGFYLTRL